jgi:hypothetical protein
MRTKALAVATALAGLAFLVDRPARAQNTYADVPFNQGSLFYRPSGAKPPATSNSNTPRRGLFGRQRGTTYNYATPPRTYAAPPRAYTPAYPQAAPGYYYPPQTAAPRYYYPTAPR